MKLSDYEFNIGDKVIDVYGDTGEIIDICKCERCVERGFFEPVWVDKFGDKHYITNYMADCEFDEFRQIGKYRFDNPFAKDLVWYNLEFHEKMALQYRQRWRLIEEMEREME